MLLSYALHIFFAQGNMVAIESFAIIQGVILVDIFNVWLQGRGCTIGGVVVHFWRVAFGAVVVFVTLEDWCFVFIKIISTVVVIVITRRVVERRVWIIFPQSQDGWIDFST